MIKSYIKLLRLHHWVKNTFILIPPFFAGNLFVLENIEKLLFGIISFSFCASAVYVFNDIRDRHEDRLHPGKQYRPIASGKISIGKAALLASILVSLAVIICCIFTPGIVMILAVYIIINVLYSLGLKNIAILDAIIVAVGFLLRIFAGGVLANVEISHWLIIMVFLLSLFLAFAKRREDIIKSEQSGSITRKVIATYNMEFTTIVLSTLSGIIIIAYIMYTVTPEVMMKFNNCNIYFTSVFVLTGIFRYLQILFVEKRNVSPVRIFYTDKFIIINTICWILCFAYIIYF